MAAGIEEWDQWRTSSRPFETMRQITLDALAFANNDEAFYTYSYTLEVIPASPAGT